MSSVGWHEVCSKCGGYVDCEDYSSGQHTKGCQFCGHFVGGSGYGEHIERGGWGLIRIYGKRGHTFYGGMSLKGLKRQKSRLLKRATRPRGWMRRNALVGVEIIKKVFGGGFEISTAKRGEKPIVTLLPRGLARREAKTANFESRKKPSYTNLVDKTYLDGWKHRAWIQRNKARSYRTSSTPVVDSDPDTIPF